MTENRIRTKEEIENSVESSLRLRKDMLEIAKITPSEEYKEALEGIYKSHMTDEEYKTYRREVISQMPPRPPYKGHFTQGEKNMIKKDWALLLPDMSYEKGALMRIARLVGPLYIGVGLGTKTSLGAEYKVTYSIHNLAYIKDFMVAGLSLQSLPGVIEFHEHKALYKKSCAYLKENAPILESKISLEDIFNAYKKRHKLNHGEAGVPAVIAAWSGVPQKAKEYLDWGYTFIEDMFKQEKGKHYLNNYDILGRKLSNDLLFKDIWLQYHKDMIANPERLREIARQEAVKFKLEFAPYQDIVGVPYKEGSLINKIR